MDFKEKFRINELLIYQNEYWAWSLRPTQLTLGASVISLIRAAESFGELNEAEASSYGKLIKLVNKATKSAFQPLKMNYLTLMLVDNQCHTHIIPRYDKPVLFGPKEYEDRYWPNIVDMGGECCVQSDITTMNTIIHALKSKVRV